MPAMAENQELAKAMARLDALTDWERRPRSKMRVGLEPMGDLAQRLSDPQKSFRSIHVAGTKGKGSVSALIEAALTRAGLSVVSLPMCNMFLQDRRAGRTPRWRGVTSLHELKRAGVDVMIASDNVRDPFCPYGDLDMLEVWREGVRVLHLDHPFAAWAPTVRAAPARAMGLKLEALRMGTPADLIVTRARDFTELFARPQAECTVLRAGVPAPPPPEYAEIDALEDLA